MTDMTHVPVEIVNGVGVTIATVSLEVPLRLELRDAMVLIAKLAGEEPPDLITYRFDMAGPGPVSESVDGPQTQPVAAADPDAVRRQMEAATRRNLEARAAAYDEAGLQAWLRTLDPANPHMSLAYDIVSSRLAQVAQGDTPAQPTSPAVAHLVVEARTLEESYRADLELAEGGDDAARLRAQETRARIVALQEDIRDGVDRREET